MVELLVAAEPKSVSEKLPDGETALHLCVRCKHLEALKVLVRLAGGFLNESKLGEFLNSKSNEGYGGNTVLHLATMLKQAEVIHFH